MHEYTLHDVVADDVPMGNSVEYMGFFLLSSGNGTYIVQRDGHLGEIDRLTADDYHDVLDLVHHMNSHVVRFQEFDYQDDHEGLIEWAGPRGTRDRERAENNDDYVYVPDPGEVDDTEWTDTDE